MAARTTRTGTSLALIAALLLTLAPYTIAHASSVRDGTELACPGKTVPTSGAAGGVHTFSVDCLQWWGINIWPTSNYQAGKAVTRGELAALLAGVLDVSTKTGAGSTSHKLPDISGHRYERQIARLNNLGVISGYSDGTFKPDRTVQRDQMASLMMRLADDVFDIGLPQLAKFPFRDVLSTSPHQPNISKVAAANITVGTSPSAYDPAGTVNRGQAATLVARIVNRLIADGLAAPKGGGSQVPAGATDTGTASDPASNSNVQERVLDNLNSLDFARHPLCTESTRSNLTYAAWTKLSSDGWGSLLSFDNAYTSRTGLQACIWKPAPAGIVDATVTIYQKPFLAFAAPSGCTTSDAGTRNGDFGEWWSCTKPGEVAIGQRFGAHTYEITFRTSSIQPSYNDGWSVMSAVTPTLLAMEGLEGRDGS